MIARSMETLVPQMERAATTAGRIARWLADNSVRRVRVLHPELIDDGAYQRVYRRQCSGAGSTFSDVRAQVGLSEGLIRVSIGPEHEDDLIADLEAALRAC